MLAVVVIGLLLWRALAPDAESGRTEALAPTPNPTGPVIDLPKDLSEVDALLVQAEAYLQYGTDPVNLGRRLDFPEDESALGLYRQVLAQQPGNAAAADGLARIADFYREAASKLCERTLWEACASNARKGLNAAPDHAGLQALLTRAERAQRGD